MMKKFICLALALLMLLACFYSCKKNNDPEGDSQSESIIDSDSETEVDTDTEEVIPPVIFDIVKDGKPCVNIIYPEDASETVATAANSLWNYFLTNYGINVMMYTDQDIPASEDTFEILVGRTNRAESEEAIANVVGSKDYYVGVIGNKLVLSGRGDDTITNAMYYLTKFISQLPEDDLKAGNIYFSDENNYLFEGNYPFPNLQLLGESVENYKIVVPVDTKNMYTLFAAELSYYFNVMTGRSMEIITDDKATGVREIWIGKMKDSTTSLGSEYEYVINVKGDCIELAADSVFAMNQMLSDAKTLISGKKLATADKKNIGEVSRVDVSKLEELQDSPVFNKLGDHRIMYHNVWGWESGKDKPVDQRNQFLYDSYMEYSPDILCLQEVTSQVRTNKTFPLIDKLCQSGYAEVDVPAVGKLMTATPILYRTDVYTLVESGVYKFQTGGGEDKFITWAVFETLDENGQGTGVKVGVLSVHLAYQTGSDGNSYRMQQVPYVVDFANDIMAEYSCPVIIGGDLNCTIYSEPYKYLTENGFEDVFNVFPKDDNGKNPNCDNYNSHYAYPKYNKDTGMLEQRVKIPSGSYANAIDHVLFKGAEGLDFKCFRVLAADFDYVMRGSDHSPLLIDFDLRPMKADDYSESEWSKNY